MWMMRHGWIVVMSLLVGCATEQTQKRQTTPDDETQSTPVEARGTAEGAIPPEQMEEITQLLDRKRQDIAHCWTDEATRQHNRNLTIDLMLRLTIGTGGRAQTVEIAKNSVNSKEFDNCVLTMVKNFDFPAIPSTVELTWPYSFKPLY
jgi:TonB family protein